MTDTTWLHGYLGTAYDDLTDEQRDILVRASERIDARWPDPDLTDLRTEALSAVLGMLLGDATDTEAVADYLSAKRAEREAHARMTGAIIGGQLIGHESEVQHAARLGVTRVTLRKALGR